MNATDRIVIEFNRLVALGRDCVALRPKTEQMVYYVVSTRCEIDIGGFASIYEQDLTAIEVNILVEALDRIGESVLASEFRRCYELLEADGYYIHMNWHNVSPAVKDQIDAIGLRVGDGLWGLDEKLALLLDNA